MKLKQIEINREKYMIAASRNCSVTRMWNVIIDWRLEWRSGQSIMLQAMRSRLPDPKRWKNSFQIYLILPATLGPGFYSAPDRNEYQKQRSNFSGQWGRGRCVGTKTLPPSVSRLSRQCGILNMSQPCREMDLLAAAIWSLANYSGEIGMAIQSEWIRKD
jgi:hypothetical protein